LFALLNLWRLLLPLLLPLINLLLPLIILLFQLLLSLISLLLLLLLSLISLLLLLTLLLLLILLPLITLLPLLILTRASRRSRFLPTPLCWCGNFLLHLLKVLLDYLVPRLVTVLLGAKRVLLL
jgi:hypothetical protein